MRHRSASLRPLPHCWRAASVETRRSRPRHAPDFIANRKYDSFIGRFREKCRDIFNYFVRARCVRGSSVFVREFWRRSETTQGIGKMTDYGESGPFLSIPLSATSALVLEPALDKPINSLSAVRSRRMSLSKIKYLFF
jgi:hypothetical protein